MVPLAQLELPVNKVRKEFKVCKVFKEFRDLLVRKEFQGHKDQKVIPVQQVHKVLRAHLAQLVLVVAVEEARKDRRVQKAIPVQLVLKVQKAIPVQ
jgi:hypothetical protein